MIANFAELPENEIAQLTDAIPYITILIAGADGEIEVEELEWAKKITEIRKFDHPGNMNDFYAKVGTNYSQRITQLMNELPGDTERRTEAIELKLAELNAILAKLDNGNDFLDSFRSFAKHVAKASGGIFGFGSISEDEARLMDLHMLKPIQGKL